MIFCYTFLLKVGSIGIMVVMNIYIAIDEPGNNPYQKQGNRYTVAKAGCFKKMYTANKPAKKNEVKEE